MKLAKKFFEKLGGPEYGSDNFDNKQESLEQLKQSAQKELGDLLNTMPKAPDVIKTAYTELLSSLRYLNDSDTSFDDKYKIYPNLVNQQRELSGPEYKDNEYAKHMLKAFNVVFMDHDLSVQDIVNNVSKFMDDNTIPKSLKNEMVTYLSENYFGNVFESEPSLEGIDISELDDDLKNAYNFVLNNKDSLPRMSTSEYYNTELLLNSPKYRNNENAKQISNVLSNDLGHWQPIHDFGKSDEAISILEKKYPNHDWVVVVQFPGD